MAFHWLPSTPAAIILNILENRGGAGPLGGGEDLQGLQSSTHGHRQMWP